MKVLIIYLSIYGFINLILMLLDIIYVVFNTDGNENGVAYIFNERFGTIEKTSETTGMNSVGSVLFMIFIPLFYFDAIIIYLYNLFQKK